MTAPGTTTDDAGAQAPANDPQVNGAGAAAPEGTPGKGDDYAELKHALSAARREAKTAQQQLATLKSATQTEQEKAVDAARAEGKKDAIKAGGRKLAAAEFRVAAAGKLADSAAVLEHLSMDQFVDDEGEVDAKAIAELVDKLAAAAGGGEGEPKTPAIPALPQGARGEGKDTQADWIQGVIHGKS